MSRPKPEVRKRVIQAVLDAHHGHSCVYAIVSVSESPNADPPLYGRVTASRVDDGSTTADADQRYAIGSCIKPMINFALYRLIEDGEAVLAESGVREIMRNRWDRSAFELYNELREHREWDPWVGPKHCKPSVIQAMTHAGACPAFPRGLIGPDGIILMSEETFGRTFAAIVDRHPRPPNSQFCYSNWNTLLLSFIITTAMNMPLADALEHLVLTPYAMHDTILSRNQFEEKRSYIAPPNVDTAVDGPTESSPLEFYDNDAALAVLGGFSSVRDMTNLFKRMWQDSKKGDNKMKEKLFGSSADFIHEGTTVMSFATGIYADLDSKAIGLESFERIPGSVPHQLGFDSGKPVKAISKAGAIRGYACHFFMIPYRELVIGVMTNTSGIADSSLLVAQYLIQQMCGLKPPMDPFEDKASKTYAYNKDVLARQATCHQRDQGFNAQELDKLQGHYIETITLRRIVIQVSDRAQRQLSVYLEEGAQREPIQSSDMRLIKIEDDILAFLPRRECLAIDAYHTYAWQHFGLEIKRRENGEVYALCRAPWRRIFEAPAEEGVEFNEIYKRE